MQLATSLLSLALAATSAWAAPLSGRQDDLQLYQLQISSPGHDVIDGQFLVSNGSTLGLLIEDQDPVTVYTTEGSKEGLLELHTYPVGVVDHALGLHGPPGLLNLVDLANPEKETDDDDLVKVWDTFRIEDGKLLNDGEGEWYSFPARRGGWILKWYDGTIGVTDDYMPVEVLLKEAGKGSYNGIES